MKAVVIIPARMAATRFPGKPLIDLCGKPMIQWVYERASKAEGVSRVMVATCDQEVIDTVTGFGGEAVMTSEAHRSGTDRLAEAASALDADVIVNVQGDEPLIDPRSIELALAPFISEPDTVMTSLMAPIDSESAKDPNLVKVVVSTDNYALYFSRSPIPYERKPLEQRPIYGHVGLYAYTKDFLLKFASMSPTPLEKAESLEQLRVLEHGYRIKMVEVPDRPLGVDTLDDLEKAREIVTSLGKDQMILAKVGSVEIGDGRPLTIIAGPCVIESEDLCLEVGCKKVKEIAGLLGMPYIFKASFDKANRTSVKSFRGPGIDKGLEILASMKAKLGVPVLTDIHEPWQAKPAAEVVDVLQIPAFLCRQTDLIVAAAETGKCVNIKKAQFLAAWDMKNSVEKARSTGNENIMLTERGNSFGYNMLVVDMCSLPALRDIGCPVVFDATHSVQRPGGLGDASGGAREFVPHLMRAAVAVGVDSLFLEVHPDPPNALCDAANMLSLADLPKALADVKAIRDALSRA